MVEEDRKPRGAREDEYPLIRELILSVWSNPNDELGIWDYLTANDPARRPEHTRIVAAGGRPVASTTLLPRRLRGPRGWVDGAEITLVACHPQYRRRGLAGSTVRDALGYMTRHGMALGVFYGVPSFYPRFGCAPVLPTLRTKIKVGEEREEREEVVAPSPALAPVAEADLPAVLGLYERHTAVYHCAVARTADSWLWQVRNPEAGALLVAEDRSAYVYAAIHPAQGRLLVREAGANGATAGRRLLSALCAEARRRTLGEVHLSLPPDHLLVRLALLAGAEQQYFPADSGFAAITRWDPLLPEGYAAAEPEGEVGPRAGADLITLTYDRRPLLKTERNLLTQLVLGYRGIDDLLLAAADRPCRADDLERLRADDLERLRADDLERLRADFPVTFPKYSEAPCTFWF